MQFFTQTASTPVARTAGRTKVCHRPSFRSFCSIMQRGSPPQVFIKDSLVHNWRRRNPTHSALWHQGSVLERPATPHWIAKIKTTALHLPDSTFLPLGCRSTAFCFLFFYGRLFLWCFFSQSIYQSTHARLCLPPVLTSGETAKDSMSFATKDQLKGGKLFVNAYVMCIAR